MAQKWKHGDDRKTIEDILRAKYAMEDMAAAAGAFGNSFRDFQTGGSAGSRDYGYGRGYGYDSGRSSGASAKEDSRARADGHLRRIRDMVGRQFPSALQYTLQDFAHAIGQLQASRGSGWELGSSLTVASRIVDQLRQLPPEPKRKRPPELEVFA